MSPGGNYLGVGTLIVKPKRHVLHVADLDTDEAEELGPLLRRTAAAVTEASADASRRGPQLQAAMFGGGEIPDPADVESAADTLRAVLRC